MLCTGGKKSQSISKVMTNDITKEMQTFTADPETSQLFPALNFLLHLHVSLHLHLKDENFLQIT